MKAIHIPRWAYPRPLIMRLLVWATMVLGLWIVGILLAAFAVFSGICLWALMTAPSVENLYGL